MKNKVLIIISILVMLLFIAGLITSNLDKARVRNLEEPKFVIKVTSEDGKKTTYWGLGYKVISYVKDDSEDASTNNISFKYGNWFMEYKNVDNKNNDKTSNKSSKEKTSERIMREIDEIKLGFDLPSDWQYEESEDIENSEDRYTIKIYKTNKDEYAILHIYKEQYGVCGTGRTSEKFVLNNGNKATISYYDGKDIWQDISFENTSSCIAIINYGLNKTESEEFLNIVKTISIAVA